MVLVCWDWTGCDGIKRNSTGPEAVWDVTRRSGTGFGSTGREGGEGTWHDGAGRDGIVQDGARQGISGQYVTGRNKTGWDRTERGMIVWDKMGRSVGMRQEIKINQLYMDTKIKYNFSHKISLICTFYVFDCKQDLLVGNDQSVSQ